MPSFVTTISLIGYTRKESHSFALLFFIILTFSFHFRGYRIVQPFLKGKKFGSELLEVIMHILESSLIMHTQTSLT
jgi:hypothetical protein